MDSQDDWMKLRIGTAGKAVAADAFIDSFRHAIDSLKAIDRGMSTHGTETIQWEIVEAGKNSPLYATIRGVPIGSSAVGHEQQIIRAFMSGVGHLSKANTCPRYFNKESLAHLRKFVAIAFLYQLAPTFSTATQEVRVEHAVAENAEWAIKRIEARRNRYIEHGSLEGILKQLSTSQKKDRLVLVDRLTGEEITCVPSDPEQLDSIIRQAWKKRVVVSGRISIDRLKRKPTRIVVESIRILRDRSQLPQIEDLHGIDITGGIESAQYVRELRNDE